MPRPRRSAGDLDTIQHANRLRKTVPKDQREVITALLEIIDRLRTANANLHRTLTELDPEGIQR